MFDCGWSPRKDNFYKCFCLGWQANVPTEVTIGEEGMLFGEAGFFSMTVVRLLVWAQFAAIQVQKDTHVGCVICRHRSSCVMQTDIDIDGSAI